MKRTAFLILASILVIIVAEAHAPLAHASSDIRTAAAVAIAAVAALTDMRLHYRKRNRKD